MQDIQNIALRVLWKQRLRLAYRAARLLSGIPFVRMVGLNGSMVTGLMTDASDIDFYIVTAPKRLYLTRAFVTLLVTVMGWRRRDGHVAGQICLNRYATTEALTIGPSNEYHARVFSGLEPLWVTQGVYKRYQQANEWMREFKYEVRASEHPLRRGWFARYHQRFGEWMLGGWLGDRLENWQRRYQQERIKRDPRTHEPGNLIFIRENELCFHAVKH